MCIITVRAKQSYFFFDSRFCFEAESAASFISLSTAFVRPDRTGAKFSLLSSQSTIFCMGVDEELAIAPDILSV